MSHSAFLSHCEAAGPLEPSTTQKRSGRRSDLTVQLANSVRQAASRRSGVDRGGCGKTAKDPPAGRAIPRLSTTDGAPVELAAQPGSEADKLARQLMAREIGKARADGADPLVLVGMVAISITVLIADLIAERIERLLLPWERHRRT